MPRENLEEGHVAPYRKGDDRRPRKAYTRKAKEPPKGLPLLRALVVRPYGVGSAIEYHFTTQVPVNASVSLAELPASGTAAFR